MKCVSWNVNGLRACVNKGFKDFFETIDADFFAIQETKLQKGQLELHFDGYYEYYNDAIKKGYSGTAIYTKHKPINVMYGIGKEEHDQEGRVITLEYDHFYFVTQYVPNSKRELERLDYRQVWEDEIRNYLSSLKENKPVIMCGDLNKSPSSVELKPKSKPIILCGDFNVAFSDLDLKNPKTNHHSAGFTDEERNKFAELLDSGFVDSYRYLYPDKVEYSWWSYMFKAREKNVGWRIDYFLTSDFVKDKIKDASIYTDILGSDHCPVGLEINL